MNALSASGRLMPASGQMHTYAVNATWHDVIQITPVDLDPLVHVILSQIDTDSIVSTDNEADLVFISVTTVAA